MLYKKRVKPFIKCAIGSVYEISLIFGKVYIGQPERCINDRVREHVLSMKNATGLHLPACCKDSDCDYKHRLDKTKIIQRSSDLTAREVDEAFVFKEMASYG